MARTTDKTDSEKVLKDDVSEHRTAQRNYFSNGSSRGWLYGLLAFVILLVVFAAGAAAANHHRMYRTVSFADGPGTRFVGPMHGGERGFITGGNYGTSTSGQSRVNGVVTAVNGSGFTVAGHGATTNVTTNSSTQYQGGSTVKQNDSVLVFGTESNGTVTATQVVVNP